MSNRFDLPNLGFGLGLRTPHYETILHDKPAIDWFEIISENYMDTDGRPRRILEQVREHYPIVMHGVSLSIGSTDPLDTDYLKKLKNLIDAIDPIWVSDHLCWTGVNKIHTHDLLPVPYTEEALKHIVERIIWVQDYLGRPLLLENPSTYLEFTHSHIPEWEFIAQMAKQSDCALLLDVNNVYVSCFNHRLNTKTYLDALPMDRVVQIHLAGHEHQGTHIIDTHDDHVVDEVWELYSYVIQKAGPVSTMIEWDANIPSFDTMKAELEKAKYYATQVVTLEEGSACLPPSHNMPPSMPYEDQLSVTQEVILSGEVTRSMPEEWVRAKEALGPATQIGVYVKGYRYRLYDIVDEDYPATRYALGDEKMGELLDAYIEQIPSTHFNLVWYSYGFAAYLKEHQECAFIAELAALEADILRLFHARETVPATSADFSALTPEGLLGMTLALREASALYQFEYPIHDFLTAFLADEEPSLPEVEASYLLLLRHDDVVWRLALEEGEYVLLSALKEGKSILSALEALLDESIMDEAEAVGALQRWFARWVQEGVLKQQA